MKKWPLVLVAGAAAVAATGYAYRKPLGVLSRQILEDVYQAAYSKQATRIMDNPNYNKIP